ncbi:MAG: sulfotransferase [Myxococcales bacterium]|nr:sulfotransferase [Myxococcales bacterium]
MSVLRGISAAINGIGGAAGRLGLQLPRLSIAGVERAAARRAGVDDFADGAHREGLAALIEAADSSALNTIGRLHMASLLTQVLATRLRLIQARRDRPAIDRGPALPPILVCGLPRSGTTFLHRLLAEREDARPLPLWELMEPIPGPGPDRRLAEAEARMRRLAALSTANLDAQHLMRAELPDECGHLFKCTMYSSIFWQAPLYSYLEWYLGADTRAPYRDYRALLGLLDRPGRRLVLKDPFHARHLSSLFAVLPEALVVQTHRDPLEVLPSFHKLTTSVHRLFTARPDTARAVELNTRWLADLVERSAADRAALPERRVCDVRYRDLVADPVGVVARIHAAFDLEFSPALAARLERFVAANGQRKYGANPYTLEQFGQRREAIAERFATYRATFA